MVSCVNVEMGTRTHGICALLLLMCSIEGTVGIRGRAHDIPEPAIATLRFARVYQSSPCVIKMRKPNTAWVLWRCG